MTLKRGRGEKSATTCNLSLEKGAVFWESRKKRKKGEGRGGEKSRESTLFLLLLQKGKKGEEGEGRTPHFRGVLITSIHSLYPCIGRQYREGRRRRVRSGTAAPDSSSGRAMACFGLERKDGERKGREGGGGDLMACSGACILSFPGDGLFFFVTACRWKRKEGKEKGGGVFLRSSVR